MRHTEVLCSFKLYDVKTCFVCGCEAVSIHNWHIDCTIWWNSIWKF